MESLKVLAAAPLEHLGVRSEQERFEAGVLGAVLAEVPEARANLLPRAGSNRQVVLSLCLPLADAEGAAAGAERFAENSRSDAGPRVLRRAAADLPSAQPPLGVAQLDILPFPSPPAGIAEALLVCHGQLERALGTVLVRLRIEEAATLPTEVLLEGVRCEGVAPEAVKQWFRASPLCDGHWYRATARFEWSLLRQQVDRLSLALGPSETPLSADTQVVSTASRALEAARDWDWTRFVAELVKLAELWPTPREVPARLRLLHRHYVEELRVQLPGLWEREVVPHSEALARLEWVADALAAPGTPPRERP